MLEGPSCHVAFGPGGSILGSLRLELHQGLSPYGVGGGTVGVGHGTQVLSTAPPNLNSPPPGQLFIHFAMGHQVAKFFMIEFQE